MAKEKITRRKFATLVGGIGLTGLAGCSGNEESPEETTTTTTETTDQPTSEETTTTSDEVTITSRDQYDEIAENFDEWEGTTVHIDTAEYYTERDDWYVFKDFQDPDKEYPYYYFVRGPSAEEIESATEFSITGEIHDVTVESGQNMLWIANAEVEPL